MNLAALSADLRLGLSPDLRLVLWADLWADLRPGLPVSRWAVRLGLWASLRLGLPVSRWAALSVGLRMAQSVVGRWWLRALEWVGLVVWAVVHRLRGRT